MKNYQPCKIKFVECVKIWMLDEIKHTWNQVKFELNIRRNLISIGMSDSKCFEWNAWGENIL